MNPAILNSQFAQVALPIVLTIFIAAWMNGRSIDGINKRIDDLRIDLTSLRADMNLRFAEVNLRLDRIDEMNPAILNVSSSRSGSPSC